MTKVYKNVLNTFFIKSIKVAGVLVIPKDITKYSSSYVHSTLLEPFRREELRLLECQAKYYPTLCLVVIIVNPLEAHLETLSVLIQVLGSRCSDISNYLCDREGIIAFS